MHNGAIEIAPAPRSGSQKRQRVKSLQIALTPEEFTVACERSNLNQIARILNAGQAIGSREAVDALRDTRAAVVQILDIVGRRDRL
jgi:hypothetical protein